MFLLIFTSFLSLNAQWAKTYGGDSYDYAHSFQQTSDGGYIIAGNTSSFNTGNDRDIWILKLSSDGEIEWQKTYGGSGREEAHFIQQTIDAGYIVAGSTDSFGAGESDIWFLKLSSAGDVEWQKAYGGDKNDSASFIQQRDDGGYIIVGHTESFGAGGADIWILRLSPAGEIEWQKAYGGSEDEEANSFQQTSDGGYIVAGRTESFGAGENDFWI